MLLFCCFCFPVFYRSHVRLLVQIYPAFLFIITRLLLGVSWTQNNIAGNICTIRNKSAFVTFQRSHRAPEHRDAGKGREVAPVSHVTHVSQSAACLDVIQTYRHLHGISDVKAIMFRLLDSSSQSNMIAVETDETSWLPCRHCRSPSVQGCCLQRQLFYTSSVSVF